MGHLGLQPPAINHRATLSAVQFAAQW